MKHFLSFSLSLIFILKTLDSPMRMNESGLNSFTFITRVNVLFLRTSWNCDLSADAPKHGSSFGCCLVPALCCSGPALSANPIAGPLCRENQQPEEFTWGCERLQLCYGCSSRRGTSVPSGYPPLQGQGVRPITDSVVLVLLYLSITICPEVSTAPA